SQSLGPRKYTEITSFVKVVRPISAKPMTAPRLKGTSGPRYRTGTRAAPTARVKPRTAKNAKCVADSAHRSELYRILCATNPATTGTMTMLNTSIIIANAPMGTNLAASTFIRKGVMNGETSVEQAVTVTASATLPRARYTITLEATPLETEPMSTTPAATS